MHAARGALVTLVFTLGPWLDAQEPGFSKVADGFGFVEGPAWHPTANHLLFSDIRGNTIHQLTGDEVSAYLEPSERANGLVFDAQGNLYVCQGGARRVIRIAPDGRRTVLVAEYDRNKLNSPNDIALDDHGGFYFTDPRYGASDDVEQDLMAVYYVARDGEISRAIDSLQRPNGILVSRDGSGLYVANPDRRELWFFPILAPGRVGAGRVLFTGDPELDGGGPDGMALDEHGHVYATYSGIVELDAAGQVIRRMPVPERPANCTFGGADGKTLFVTARTGLYSTRLDVRGAPARSTVDTPPADIPLKEFEAVVVDAEIDVGYGVAVANVGGSDAPDLVLVDRDTVAWYENPSWQEHVIARQLTPRDHVCIAARDIDGDGLAEIAVGAGWNPADTIGSGSLHYLRAGTDPTQPWTPIRLPHEPTVHRTRWLRGAEESYELLVAPLHGRGNRAGRGPGVRLLTYRPPQGEPDQPWWTALVDDSLHQTHNIDPVQWDDDPEDELLVAGTEGIFLFDRAGDSWQRQAITGPAVGETGFRGASEVRAGRLSDGRRFVASIEPFHGNQLVFYTAPERGSPRRSWRRTVLADDLAQGHALACGDLVGAGADQIVVGWRGINRAGMVGLRLYLPRDARGRHWQVTPIDDGTMACEDLRLADIDGDGLLDVVAAGRSTHNLVIYFNRE